MKYAAAVLLAALGLAGCVAPPPGARVPGAVLLPPTAADANIPPFARDPYEPFSREAAVQIALGEWRAFRSPVKYPGTSLPEDDEREEGGWQRVGLYWWLGLGPNWRQSAWTGIHDASGRVFPADRDGDYAWSAAFISYVMRMAGAGDHFPYSETHSDYINAAARHEPGVWLEADRVTTYAPQPGDLICLWRGRTPVTFDELPAGRFAGHCAIVVGNRPGEIEVIGGNVDNAVTMEYIPVTATGLLAGPDGAVLDPDHHWFVVLKVLYQKQGTTPPALVAAAAHRERPG
jgi:Uncharacterized protein conserved in bacteria (DUF2272)